MCVSLGFSLTSNLRKYVGVPLHHKRVTKESYQYVVDKGKTWLSKWKANSLSSAGRSTFISSVTSTNPRYIMQMSLLSMSTCMFLDRCNHQFLWGINEDHQKIPLVAWDAICRPKQRGGLGLQYAKYHNHTYLMKLCWKLAANKNNFLAKVICNKYNCGSDIITRIDAAKISSNLWDGIKRTCDKVQDGIEVLANGQLCWKWT